MNAPADIAVDPDLEDEPEEEQPAKRPRLNEDNQESSIEDEAVLNALTDHNNPTTPGEYSTE